MPRRRKLLLNEPISRNVLDVLFPLGFLLGTSTSAAQIETASDHDWRGFVASDGSVLNATTNHEQRRDEDAKYIEYLGNAYRFSLDWARLQPSAAAEFDKTVVDEYLNFILKVSLVSLDKRLPFFLFICTFFISFLLFFISFLLSLQQLRSHGVRLMLVLHHFCTPNWFMDAGGNDRSLLLLLLLLLKKKYSANLRAASFDRLGRCVKN